VDHALHMRTRLLTLLVLSVLIGSSCAEEHAPTNTSDDPPGPEENQPPVLTSVYSSPASIGSGDTAILTCEASDPEGDRLEYSWTLTSEVSPSGYFTDKHDNQITWNSPARRDTDYLFWFSVTVTDEAGNKKTKSLSVPVATKLRTFYADKDAAVGEDYPDDNTLSEHDFLNPRLLGISARSDYIYERRIYLFFDLSSIACHRTPKSGHWGTLHNRPLRAGV